MSAKHWTNCYVVLYCRVITGDYTKGAQNMDEKHLYKSDGITQYDSLVDDINNPTIFVINRDYHALPTHIIVFKDKNQI